MVFGICMRSMAFVPLMTGAAIVLAAHRPVSPDGTAANELTYHGYSHIPSTTCLPE